MTETHEHRLKRMLMRATHRGIKEMDIILGNYARANLSVMEPAQLDQLDALMEENDQDLYQWVSGQMAAPDRFAALIERIAQHAGAR
ncbi:succinate dehydrogenase assembly factor 2 [Actibacterium sp. XHP0104]|uniref:succinate dehydrogenase assembly factor 2 n=1 Tax=Actibacterium sp. XHP0104 TaxID=2984335 RepID=UPI0021E8AB1F|nr:succinate dehydrogenase assembly factor 2 [Actibacterium sp. XHP0104]MCV2881277.1 succinate dehydrogenase assembly factor 2 [Actibacterium sp. XHP0104]